MPPERHSAPPPRPPRDRGYSGPGFGGPRRSFSGGGFAGGGPGGPRDSGPRPPFTPRPPLPPAEPAHSVRLRDGDHEVEVHGSAAFVRQTLDELPALFARLRGEAPPPSRPQSISMPRPPLAQAHPEPDPDLDADEDEDEDDEPAPPPVASHRRERHGATNGKLTLEDKVFRALQRADHPLSVAAIRKLVGGDTSGQQIRRILERASDRVVATDERPAAYALR